MTLKQFKIVRGLHRQGGVTYGSREAAKNYPNVVDRPVESEVDLAAQFPGKFVPLDEVESSVTEEEQLNEEGDPEFDKMTVADLKLFAQENEVDLGEATTKAEILSVVKAAWNGED